MAELKFNRTYRTYRYIDKNPVIDKVRTILQDEGLYTKKKRNMVHQLSGVATTTLDNWFDGDTKNPQHHTIAAVVTSLGYEETFQRVKNLDMDKELEIAAKWLAKQREQRELFSKTKKTKKAKTNGSKGTK